MIIRSLPLANKLFEFQTLNAQIPQERQNMVTQASVDSFHFRNMAATASKQSNIRFGGDQLSPSEIAVAVIVPVGVVATLILSSVLSNRTNRNSNSEVQADQSQEPLPVYQHNPQQEASQGAPESTQEPREPPAYTSRTSTSHEEDPEEGIEMQNLQPQDGDHGRSSNPGSENQNTVSREPEIPTSPPRVYLGLNHSTPPK